MKTIITLIVISILTLIFIYILAKIFIKTSIKIFEFIKEFLWDFIFIIFLVLIFVFLIIATLPYFMDVISRLSDFISLRKEYEISFQKLTEGLELSRKQKGQELHNQFISNFGWIIWTGISIVGLLVTLILTILGRCIQRSQWKIQERQWRIQVRQWKTQNNTHKLQLASHLQERYEKAASILESEDILIRISGCQALGLLGKENESMKEQCVRLLFSFIRNPYLEMEYEGKNLDEVFPIDQILRDDIQEAADSFSEIYDKYKNEGVGHMKIILPDYFLKNILKKPISLIKANLIGIECKRINLQRARLQGINLENTQLLKAKLQNTNLQEAILTQADLREADLSNANLQKAILSFAGLLNTQLSGADLHLAMLIDADISGAKMQDAEGLTKEQVLSAIWGYSASGQGGIPSLPKELAKDLEVREWLESPHYDFREEGYDYDDLYI